MINPFARGIKDRDKVEIIYQQAYSQIIKPYQKYLSQLIDSGVRNEVLLNAITPIWNQQSKIYHELVQEKRTIPKRKFTLIKRLDFKIIAQAKILEQLNDPMKIRLSLKK